MADTLTRPGKRQAPTRSGSPGINIQGRRLSAISQKGYGKVNLESSLTSLSSVALLDQL